MKSDTGIRDFPDWFGPMLVKELRRGLKLPGFVFSFVCLQAVFICITTMHAIAYQSHSESTDGEGFNAIFWFFITLQLVCITPLRALNDLATEQKARTLELIFMTGLTPWRITVGKWAALQFQSALVVAALLPYGIARYFFGGVNLSEDFVILCGLMVLSAVASAAAIAVSSFPPLMRAVAAIGALFLYVASSSSMLLARSGVSSIPRSSWLLWLFDAALLCLFALDSGAARIAPPAFNHAGRQRLLSFALLLPLPLMWLVRADAQAAQAQLLFFAGVALLAAQQHLAAPPFLLRRHLEPFARFGRLGCWLSLVLQPGWPGGILYLCAVEALFFIFEGETSLALKGGSAEFRTPYIMMAGAALLTGPLIWTAIRRRSANAAGEQFGFLLIASALTGCAYSVLSSASILKVSGGLATCLTAAFPPAGFWFMVNSDRSAIDASWIVAIAAFVGYAFLFSLFARKYWRATGELFAEVCRDRKAPAAKTP